MRYHPPVTIRDDVLATLRACQPAVTALGVRSLRLFGSVGRGDDRPTSDVDILVEFEGPATFDACMDLKFLLEDALGRRVDLVTVGGLREELRESVLAEALRVAS
jgi:predicted nucleotidyltransferase